MPNSSADRLVMLSKYGISNPEAGQWYKQQSWLDAFKEIAENVGPTNLRLIGKSIIKSAQFPPIENTQQAFSVIDVAYKMNHKGGEIGYYKLLSYDESNKTIKMETNTPYPEEFDNGIFLGVFDKFKPKGGYSPTSTYKKVGDKIEYTINWQ